MDKKKMEEMKKTCGCGSGKQAGKCCMKDEKCPCGSGMKACDCCMKE